MVSAVSSRPTTIFWVALSLGYFLGRRLRKNERNFFRDEDSTSLTAGQRTGALDFLQAGVTPDWLNYALSRVWALFQKNTMQLTQEAIQPVLDDVEKPDIIQAIRLVKYKISNRAPIIKSLVSVPARSLAEIQCSYRVQLDSTSDLLFEVDVNPASYLSLIPWRDKNATYTIPVTLKNLKVDALLWSAFTMAPYPPYCTTWRYSLIERPSIDFDMKIGGALPITSVPLLRTLFFKIMQTEIPKDFTFPKSNTVDFTEDNQAAKRTEFMEMEMEEIDKLSEDEIKEDFPKQWALYNSLDLNSDGNLSQQDLSKGLSDWGYSTEDTNDYFEQLDPNQRGYITFCNFCMMWPNVTTSEVPQMYEGRLSVVVDQATGMKKPLLFGWSDPVVRLSVGNETIMTDQSSEMSSKDKNDTLLWNESLNIDLQNITEELQVTVERTSGPLMFGGLCKTLARGSIDLSCLETEPHKSVVVKLKPKGELLLDMSYGKFVDRWNLTFHSDEEEEEKDITLL